MNNFKELLERVLPSCVFTIEGDDYSTIVWAETNEYPLPDEAYLVEWIARIKVDYMLYRLGEYPDVLEYIDGIVKGDQQQIDNYIADCLSVKAKYPKTEE